MKKNKFMFLIINYSIINNWLIVCKTYTAQKMKLRIWSFCGKESADLVTFTKEILNEKLHALCSDSMEYNIEA